MKKIISMILALAMVLSLAACGNKDVQETEAPETVATESVENTEIADTDGVDPDTAQLKKTETMLIDLVEMCPTEFPVMTWALDLTDAEAFKAYTGLDSTDGIIEASVTEPAMSSQAYSVVLVQVAEGADANAIAEAMKAGINPAKWVCVEADEIDVVVDGEYVLLAMMSSEFAESISVKTVMDAFAEMMGHVVIAEEETVEEGAEVVVDATEAVEEPVAETEAIVETEVAETEAAEEVVDETEAAAE